MTAQPAEAAPPRWLPWAIWSLGALLFFYGFFQRLAPSVMIDPLMRELSLDGAAVGNLSAFYFYAYAGMQVPIGLMVDRFGPRFLLTGGALICALATAGFALADSPAVAFLCRFLVGFGAGFAFVSTLTLAARWFSAARFAQFTGLTMMAGMLGGFLAQAPLAALVETVGWRHALLGSAAAGVLLAAVIWTVVRDWPPGTRPVAVTGRGFKGLLFSVARVLTRWRNISICLISAGLSAPMLGFAGFWGVAWLMQTHGLERAEAGATTSILLIGWAVGSPLAGWVSDKIGRRKPVLQAGCVICLLALSLLLYVDGLPTPLLWLCFFLTGASGGCMSVSFALARMVNPPSETSAVLGFVNCAVTGTGAVFQPLIGFLLDLSWDGTLDAGARVYSADAFGEAFSVLIGFLVFALLLSLLLKEPREATKAA